MKKNNIFNKIFHSKEVKNNIKLLESLRDKVANYDTYKQLINNCKSLTELLSVHKYIFNEYQNKNLDVDKYGMFRGKSIETLQASEVYLGNIWGLWTHNIPFWEDHKNEKYGYSGFNIDPDTLVYSLIYNQYYRILTSNIDALYNQYCKQIRQLKKHNYK